MEGIDDENKSAPLVVGATPRRSTSSLDGTFSAMPSIEIACIGAERASEPPLHLSFALEYEVGLKSHRSPAPRFQIDFDRTSGALYHLGSRSPKQQPGSGPFFAYELLSTECQNAHPHSFLEFAPQHLVSVQSLLKWILQVSPVGLALFTSDWQFGPEGSERHNALTLDSFWKLHDARQLHLNALYRLVVT